MRDRTHLVQQLAHVMTSVDVVVTPGAVTPAPVLGKGAPISRASPSFARPFNVTGSPALAVCNGFNEVGLPLSMQIVGRPFEDHVVLRAGHAFEAATQFRNQRPKLTVGVSAAAQ
jgi:aspartyl-tRNA(Asn)/glutamyl-tRNA(Gln) amidotransferase subunit A